MFRHILVAVAGSAQAEDGLAKAIELAQAHDARLTILTAVQRSLASASMTAGAAALPELLQAQSVAILRKAADTVPRDIP